MSFLHPFSCECAKSELDLFTLPPTQTSIESGHWVQYKPVASITDDSPVEFSVPGTGDNYLDLSHTLLNLKIQVVKQNNETLTVEDDNVGCVNNILSSLFSQVDVFLNQKLVSSSNNTYAYRAYLETLLSYGPAAKTSHLTTALWYEDTPKYMNDLNNNNGLAARREFTKRSKTLDLVGYIHSDVFNQEKFLINGVEVRLKFIRSKPEFCLMGPVNSNLKIVINDANLFIRRVKINPTVMLAHNKALEIGNAKYPITRVQVKTMTIPTGVQSKTMDNIFLGQIPKRIIVGFTTNKAFNGDYTLNPFNFSSFNISYISIFIDGDHLTTRSIQSHFSRDLYVNAFHTLFTGTGIHYLNEGNSINRTQYPNGYCLLAFDLTPDLSANQSAHWNLIKQGSLRLDVRFDQALTESINCVVYAEFDNIFEIDKNRNVIADFAS